MATWYFSYGKNTDRIGPLDDAAARAQARRQPDGYCWCEGFTEWQPIRSVTELGGTPLAPPPVPAALGGGRAHGLDYRIVGPDMLLVEIKWAPGTNQTPAA